MPVLGTEMEYAVSAPGNHDIAPEWLAAAVVANAGVAATPFFPDSLTRMLGNGGRLYVDHGHPEYCTPETTSAAEAVLYELAGDRLVREAAQRASRAEGLEIRIHRNNTDGKGNSYGYHENVAVSRDVDWGYIERHLPTFLATRLVYTGAGRLGLGRTSKQPGFQLSQRADFFTRVSGLDTMRNRGLVNTRDEPHADPGRWRRLHVIAGDANRNPWASWLRLGTLGAFVQLLETGEVPEVGLADPVQAIRTVSRDMSLAERLPLRSGRTATALEIQAEYQSAVRARSAEQAAVVKYWGGVLAELAVDPETTGDRLDWPARWSLIRAYQRRLGCGLDDARLQALDLAWADLGPGSPWERLAAAGRFPPWTFAPSGPGSLDAAVERAMSEPPDDTRAHTRGRIISEHSGSVAWADWASMGLRGPDGGYRTLYMPEPTGHDSFSYPPPEVLAILGI